MAVRVGGVPRRYMNVGSAAGVAAKQLIDGEVSTVHDVVVSKVARPQHRPF